MSESELPPARVRGQRTSKCTKCDGAIRYYPRPGIDQDTADAEIVGQWVHLNRDDWLNDPHDPVPVAEEPSE